ncbi:MAG: SDR family oxidoreductase [Verrucomicrobia bacterium]|nr:SDR family oxidoreductase [Verrucomicrobiota bacterium]
MLFPELRGRIVLVTGASRRRGIGAAICRAFAGQGCDVFFTVYKPFDDAAYRDASADPDGPPALAEELRAQGVRAAFMEIDLGHPEAPGAVLANARAGLGSPSVLVNNAAHSARDGYESLTVHSLDRHYAVNLRAVAMLSVGFARAYDQAHGGRVVNLTSGQDLTALPGELAYAASKGAISAFTRSLAKELAQKGFTVNAVDPGPTDTGWVTDEMKASLNVQSGFGRLGAPEDAARLIVFLASDAARWITGQVIHSRADL